MGWVDSVLTCTAGSTAHWVDAAATLFCHPITCQEYRFPGCGLERSAGYTCCTYLVKIRIATLADNTLSTVPFGCISLNCHNLRTILQRQLGQGSFSEARAGGIELSV